jgi:hypothetical protein
MTIEQIIDDLVVAQSIHPLVSFSLDSSLQAALESVAQGECPDEETVSLCNQVGFVSFDAFIPGNAQDGHGCGTCLLKATVPASYPASQMDCLLDFQGSISPDIAYAIAERVRQTCERAKTSQTPIISEVVSLLQGAFDEDRARLDAMHAHPESLTKAGCHCRVNCCTAESPAKCKEAGHAEPTFTADHAKWAVLVHIDHMRDRKAYHATLKSIAKQLTVSCKIMLYSRIIAFLVVGIPDATKQFLVRLRSQNVDIDRKGRPCKERMATVLHSRKVPDDWYTSPSRVPDGSLAEHHYNSKEELMSELQQAGVNEWPFHLVRT